MPRTILWNKKSVPRMRAEGTGPNTDVKIRRIRLVADVITLAVIGGFIFLLFFNPSRVGEITVTVPGGPAITVKVANSNDISKLIWSGLKNKRTAAGMTISLLSLIEHLDPNSELAKNLIVLVESRQPPFLTPSIPVKLEYDPQVPGGIAASCEGSPFLAKNIVVYAVKKDDDMVYNSSVHVDVNWAFPCPDGADILRINSTTIEGLKPSNKYKMFAKLDF